MTTATSTSLGQSVMFPKDRTHPRSWRVFSLDQSKHAGSIPSQVRVLLDLCRTDYGLVATHVMARADVIEALATAGLGVELIAWESGAKGAVYLGRGEGR